MLPSRRGSAPPWQKRRIAFVTYWPTPGMVSSTLRFRGNRPCRRATSTARARSTTARRRQSPRGRRRVSSSRSLAWARSAQEGNRWRNWGRNAPTVSARVRCSSTSATTLSYLEALERRQGNRRPHRRNQVSTRARKDPIRRREMSRDCPTPIGWPVGVSCQNSVCALGCSLRPLQ
jgi:hypothetical protein